MIIFRLRLKATCLSASKSTDKSEPTYSVDNSGILAKEALAYSLIICDNTENVIAKQKNIVILRKKLLTGR
jgi:hypothetical protein